MSRTFLYDIPVAPVLAALGRTPDERGRYWCPFHDDERPGGRPSAEVHEDQVTFTCWSCGATATAAQLVAAIRGVTIEEGLHFAMEVRAPMQVTTKHRRPVTPERLEDELRRQTVGIRYPRDVDPVAAFVESRGWPRDLERYVRESWGWAGDYRGRVVIPWRDAAGRVTGVRYRVPPRWVKDGRRNSRFRQLYGVWRVSITSVTRTAVSEGNEGIFALYTQLADEVWVCEGETDTVWAAWSLEPAGVSVLGLPTALYRPRDDELELFRDRKVVIAVDGDAAGERARKRWAEMLDGVADEVIMLALPRGQDLCSLTMTPSEVRDRL